MAQKNSFANITIDGIVYQCMGFKLVDKHALIGSTVIGHFLRLVGVKKIGSTRVAEQDIQFRDVPSIEKIETVTIDLDEKRREQEGTRAKPTKETASDD